MHDDLDLNLEPSEPSVPDVDQAGVSLPQGEVDHEGAMAKADLYKLANYSLKLFKKIQDGDQLEGWVQAKITKAADYIASVYHYLEYEMEFSEYGKKLDNSDVLSESQKEVLKNKLMEARSAIKQLKLTQAEKQFGQVEEGILSGGEQTCPECGGSGTVMMPERQIPEELKGKVKSYNRKAKAMAAAVKRVDANKNGIPDDEEVDESRDDEPAAPDADLIAKRKAREAAQRRREEKADADADDLSKDYKPKGEKSSGTKKVAGKAYGGSAQKDDREKEVDEGQGGVYGQGVYEGKSKKAKKDYDQDGKIESEKDEVIGSRRKAAGLDEASKPDYIDLDKDGDKKEPMKKAAKEKKVAEAAPSAGMSKKEKSAVVKKAKAGGDIGKPGKGFKKVAAAAKKGGAKDPEAVAAAAMWKQQAKECIKEGIEHAVEEGMSEQEYMTKLNWLRQNKPRELQAALQSNDPNALNKLIGFVPAAGQQPTQVVSPDEGPTSAVKPTVVKESADLARMKEFLTRLNG